MMRAAFFLVLLSLVLAPLLLGGNRPWVSGILAPLILLSVALACGAQWCARIGQPDHPAVPTLRIDNPSQRATAWGDHRVRILFSLTFTALCLWFEISRRWISVDAASSAWHVNQLWLMLGVVFVIDQSVHQDPRRAWVLCQVLVVSSVLQAFIGFELFATGRTLLVFFERVVQETPKGTFVNRNHAAAYFNIGLACATGLMLARLLDQSRSDRLRAILRFAVGGALAVRLMLVVLVIALIATRSRAGNTIFLIGLGVIALWTLRSGEGFSVRQRRALAVFFCSVLLLDVLIIGSVVGFDRVLQRLGASRLTDAAVSVDASSAQIVSGLADASNALQEETLQSRLRPALACLNALPDFGFLGAGGKTFQWVFPAYKPATASQLHFEHAHNDPVEHLVEGGLPGFTLLCVLVFLALWAAWRVVRRAASLRLRMCGMGFLLAMGMTLAHSFVDFPTQIFSIALTLCAVAACSVALLDHLTFPVVKPSRRSAHVSIR